MLTSHRYRPSTALLDLDEGFFDRARAARSASETLRLRNGPVARDLGLDELDDVAWRRHFAHLESLPGSLPEPLAMRYHGHRFRAYDSQLGDARGFTLGQLYDAAGHLIDLGAEGTGPTPHSHGGDGRMPLEEGVREVLATELLEALGVPSSRVLSLYEVPGPDRRGVLVRACHGHIRVGTFQCHAYLPDRDDLVALLRYTARHHLPEVDEGLPDDELACAVVAAACRRTARLAAGWTVAGFVHGRLGTDVHSVSGEGLGYGACRFVATCDPLVVADPSDATGLFAFARQPQSLLWNLERLCDALHPVVPRQTSAEALADYEPHFATALADRFCYRLGVTPRAPAEDRDLANTAITWLMETRAPYAQFFADWRTGSSQIPPARRGDPASPYAAPSFEPVARLLRGYTPAIAPAAWGPAPTVAAGGAGQLWSAVHERDDWAPFEAQVAEIRALGGRLSGQAAR